MPSTDRVQRRLAAILVADVEGYARLMGEDDAGTVKAITACRELVDRLAQENQGRVVNAPGDQILAEFPSVVDAVSGAVAMQRELAERNLSFPVGRKMRFRMGINLGDVVVQDDQIFGDGVNIAARMQALAEPGGICLSGSAYDQVESKVNLRFDYLGEQKVKNIARPVRTYRILMLGDPAEFSELSAGTGDPAEAAGTASGADRPAEDRPALARPPQDLRHTLAVLPFANMSAEAEQEFFADGLTEDLITDLAASPRLKVIARNTMFTYKGKSVPVTQLRQELGATHVVEGSVRKSGSRLRLTAQLIDAATGQHLWAGRFDRGVDDVFGVQDEIVKAIVTELQVRLLLGEQARAWRSATSNPKAYEQFLRGIYAFGHLRTAQDVDTALHYFIEAVSLDPEFASAHAMLAALYRTQAQVLYAEDQDHAVAQCAECARRAQELADGQPGPYTNLGFVELAAGRHAEAEALWRKAVHLNPNSIEAVGNLGLGFMHLGRYAESLELLDQAAKLAPKMPAWIHHARGVVLFFMGQFDTALIHLLTAKGRGWKPPLLLIYSAACFGALGREEECRSEVQALVRMVPHFTAAVWRRQAWFPAKDKEAVVQLLIQAGLPQ